MLNVQIDSQDFERKLNRTIAELPTLMDNLADEMRKEVYSIVINVLEKAIKAQGSGFPPIYRTHVLSTASRVLKPEINISGGVLSVSINLDDLGESSDLEPAFHYGARLASGGKVTLPFYGDESDLKNTSKEKRRVLWLTKFSNDQETYQARVNYWNSIGKAPEWTYLLNGQTWSPPFVFPYPIEEEIKNRLKEIAIRISKEILDDYISNIYRGQTKNNFSLVEYGKTRYEFEAGFIDLDENLTPVFQPSRPGYAAIRGGNPKNRGQFSSFKKLNPY